MIDGWAADIAAHRPADAVLFFAGERLIAKGTPRFTRYDVFKADEEKSLLYSGFSAVIPRKSLRRDEDELRVFVVSHNGRALELRFRKELKNRMHIEAE